MSETIIEISDWYSNGKMMYRRESLPKDHPESMYQKLLEHGFNEDEI